ncbi:MAG: condensation domain-containing protein [Gordonia sp. (in: high G+C Gram-positive bacteria)]
MVNFGLIDEWNPRPGQVTSWTLSRESVAAASSAPIHPIPASHQQEEYLRAAQRNEKAGFRFSRLCLEAFDFQTPLNVDALTRTLNAYLRRHDAYWSWFSAEDDGSIARHLVDPELLSMVPSEHGYIGSAAEIREHVQQQTPGPFHWDCFTFGTIEWEGGFTLYAAVDHLDTDGISQALTCVELITLYMNEAFGLSNPLPDVASYVQYCERERSISRALTRESPEFRTWLEIVQSNGGRLPSFPLPLGSDPFSYTRSAHLSTEVFTEEDAVRFEKTCRDNGSNVASGLLAVAALAYSEFTGRSDYLGMTPKSTRTTRSEMSSVGWFTSLIPVPITVEPGTSFTEIAGAAAKSFTAGKALTDVSFHRVLELTEPSDGIDVPAGWTAPMLSYIDVRRLPGVDMFDAINGCLYGNRGSSDEVFVWINRFKDRTSMTLLYPDTEIARESIQTYIDKYRTIMQTIAAHGDYVLNVPTFT